MKQLINRPEEETHDNYDRNASEIARMAIPYLLQLFHAGLEKRHGVRLSIQCTDSGTFRGTITALVNLGEPSERGVVAFTNNESVDGILEYFETALTYGELDWKMDKYWAEQQVKEVKTPSKRVKLPLHL